MASRGSYELAPTEGSEGEDGPLLNEKGRPWRSSRPAVDMFNKVMAFVNVILALALAASLALVAYSWAVSAGNCKQMVDALEPYCPYPAGNLLKIEDIQALTCHLEQPRHSRRYTRSRRNSSRTSCTRARLLTLSKRHGTRYWARTEDP